MSTFLHHTATPNPPCFLSYSLPSPLKLPLKSTIFKPLSISIKSCYRIPARDRVIDFGKYKGKMLGTLPSTYLRWVSANLRARDFEDWAKLADQVLQDPVYQDRLEWEFAQKILNGDVLKAISSSSSSSAVSSLLEISERFGWDNEDKLGWRKLNFELLGTSNGGRIPRIKDKGLKVDKNEDMESCSDDDDEVNVRDRREGRRQRLKLKTSVKSTSQRLSLRCKIGEFDVERRKTTMEVSNPFPGREGLLKRVMDAKAAIMPAIEHSETEEAGAREALSSAISGPGSGLNQPGAFGSGAEELGARAYERGTRSWRTERK